MDASRLADRQAKMKGRNSHKAVEKKRRAVLRRGIKANANLQASNASQYTPPPATGIGSHRLELYRQGNVLLQRIKKIPFKSSGEIRTSGHLFEADAVNEAYFVDNLEFSEIRVIRGRTFLVVGLLGVRIIHKKHDDLVLPAGIFEVKRRREYQPKSRQDTGYFWVSETVYAAD
jgi:hypothetical protein